MKTPDADLAALLERALVIGDGAPDGSPLALEALQLAGDIKAALGGAP